MSERLVSRRTVVLRLAIALITAMAIAQPAIADTRVELLGGPSYMDSYSTAAAFGEVIWGEHAIGASRFSWAPMVSLGWIDSRHITRFDDSRYSTRHATELLAGGARFHFGRADDWYRSLFLSFEPAYNHRLTQALSTHYEFVTSLGWQSKYVTVQFRHISNGSFHQPNRGETMLLAGVGFDF